MSEQPTSADGAPPRSRLVRWLLVVGALCGVVYVVLLFVPVYHVEYENNPDPGTNSEPIERVVTARL